MKLIFPRFIVSFLLFISITPLLMPGGSGIVRAESMPDDTTSLIDTDTRNPKLDSALNQLVISHTETETESRAVRSYSAVQEPSVQVVIECSTKDTGSVGDAVSRLGVPVEISYENMVQATVPVSGLAALAENEDVDYIRLPMEPMYSEAVSEGVSLIAADDWHLRGYTGAGVKIAVLDGGFYGYTSLLGTELPPSVTPMSFCNIPNIYNGTSHGTSCAEIVYDIAPDAEMYLVNFSTELEYIQAVNWLISQEVDIITSSVGWPISGPGDGTGAVCDVVSAAAESGIYWSISAGNSAKRHWQGDWVSTNGDNCIEFGPDYSTDQNTLLRVYQNDTITVCLKWDDPWDASGNDYNMVLYNSSGHEVAYSIRVQNGNDYPREYISYTAPSAGEYYIRIQAVNNPDPVHFHMYSYKHDFEIRDASGSLSVPADVATVTAVAAAYQSDPGAIEYFSSWGPTTDGRIKPDITAPDGVSTSGGYFYGTSAAAPHVGGAAVLVKQAFPEYSREQIELFLSNQAVDLGDAGKDIVFGEGRLYLGSPALAVSTIESTSVSPDTVTLHGTLDEVGLLENAEVSFEYGMVSESLDLSTASGSMSMAGSFDEEISGLLPDTMYYFRAKATVFDETVYGSELSFHTPYLESLAIKPADAQILSGRTQHFTAAAVYSDGYSEDITDGVTWISSDTSIVTIDAVSGLATGSRGGLTSVSAAYDGVTGTTGVQVLTSVEVNSGSFVKLPVGDVISCTSSSGIPVTVKGLPVTFDPENGLQSFDIVITWDPDIISLDSVIPGDEATAAGWSITIGNIDNIKGTVEVSGSTTVCTSDDVVLFYLGVGAQGVVGDTTCVTITSEEFMDSQSQAVPAYSLESTVRITSGGDADNDGSVNVRDVSAVIRMILGIDDPSAAGDVSGDGTVNALDLTEIVKVILGYDQ